jgi:ubiquitin carboxyl-terminal hydrolase 25/28
MFMICISCLGSELKCAGGRRLTKLQETHDKFWILPTIDLPSEDTFAIRSKRQFIEDVVCELSERMTEGPPMEVAHLPTRYVYNPLPATNDIYNTLGCLDYIKGSRTIINLEEQVHEHPHYAGLGAVNDFSDALIAFAYERQRDSDPQNSPYYLECLQGIGQGRGSVDLQEKSVMAISIGEHTLKDIENAYKFFTISPDTNSGDDHIIGLYKSRIEAAPRQKEEARQCLLIIGQARQSETIQAIANDRAMSFEEALDYLNVSQDTPPDSIEAVAITMVCRSYYSQRMDSLVDDLGLY